MKREPLRDRWTWWRIAESSWENPLDAAFAEVCGGRWNPPHSFPTLYLNEDKVTARLNLRMFIAGWPYEPEDLRPDNAPVLVAARLPRRQVVCDAHTREGLKALGLPGSYPLDPAGNPVPHLRCQPIGQQVYNAGLRGLRVRSAQTEHGAGRELAWFPATARSKAVHIESLTFDEWYWG